MTAGTPASWLRLLPLLICPNCGETVAILSAGAQLAADGEVVISRFESEWASLSEVDTPEQSDVFGIYFDLVRAGDMGADKAVLLSSYEDRSFRIMRNDRLDRFGTRLEKRFTGVQLIDLIHRAGLDDIHVSDDAPNWHAVGRRTRT